MNGPDAKILRAKIDRTRQLAHSSLARFSQLDANDCSETYLFQKDHFCGIQFELGPFVARWLLDDQQIEISREGKKVVNVELESQNQSRAA